jgi:hypothetical protein
MPYSEEHLNDIFDRTDCKCHLCHKRLAFKNYAQIGKRGAWEVEHSIPKANGGTDHPNNLYAACIPCNRKKGTLGTRAMRKRHGVTCAPLCREAREQAKQTAGIDGLVGGALIGLCFGPVGAVLGAFLGGTIGYEKNPDR